MHYSRSAHVAWRVLGKETVVVDLMTNRMVALDREGGAVWSALADGGDLATIVERLAGPDAAMDNDDVERFLGELTALGLVQAPGLAAPSASQPGSNRETGPRILWEEELRSVAACAHHTGETPLCTADPYS